MGSTKPIGFCSIRGRRFVSVGILARNRLSFGDGAVRGNAGSVRGGLSGARRAPTVRGKLLKEVFQRRVNTGNNGHLQELP